MRSLQRDEAVARFDLLTITGYDVTLDLRGEDSFTSRTVIDLVSRGGNTFLDLKPVRLEAISLDGSPLPVDAVGEGRYPLSLPAGEHRVEVSATMSFRNDGEGLHRAVDPADGRAYVYQMSFMSAAPSVFACFDQPDLKAPYTMHVTAPADWSVTANAPGKEVEPGVWEFETSQPLSTYFVTLVGGPYHRIADVHDGIPLGLLCRESMSTALETDADELFTLTKQCFDEFHRLFGIRYPFGKYDQAWVPEFNAGAMENPGCVTFREALLFTTKVPRSMRIQRATTLAHEMAHQWFGNLTTPRWWDDLWLNEAFAEYMGNRVTAEVTEFTEALVWASVTRKNWGLTADSRPSTHPVAGTGAVDADAALQDFDGISYSKGHAVLTQLADRVGDEVFFGGVREHFESHRFGNATMRDLFDSWERAGAGDLGPWTSAWLRTAGLDRIDLDRDAGTLVRTPPPGPPADREHVLGVATWDGTGWTRTSISVSEPVTPVEVPADAPVVLDPRDTAWADLTLDPVTATGLPGVFAQTIDPLLRATIWITARNGVHHARLDPDHAVGIVCAGVIDEELDSAIGTLGVWAGDDGEGSRGVVHEKLLSVVRDPDTARARVHAAFVERSLSAARGSDLQLAAVQAAIGTATETSYLRQTLDGGQPRGIELDAGLRWRILKRLTSLGDTDLGELDRALAEENDAKTQIAHAWCHARLPDPDAKAWAWLRFTGEEKASNYEIEAIGTGFWQSGREELVTPYVDRYFDELPATTSIRAGWGLADGAHFFFPITVVTPDTLARVEALLADGSLNPSIRRTLVDAGDELRCRLAAPSPVRPMSVSDPGRRPGPSVRARVVELTGDRRLEHEDRLATEEPLEVRLSWPGSPARRIGVTMRTPGQDFELAAGWLVHEQVIGAGDIAGVKYCTDAELSAEEEFNVVTVESSATPLRLPEARLVNSACGVCGSSSVADVTIEKPIAVPRLALEAIRALPGKLRDEQPGFERTGGLHAAGLFDGSGKLIVVREDVGRHNAVDKAAGSQLLAGAPMPPVLVLSGRIGFELVQKAAVSGIGLVVAVGAPSSLAVALAERVGIAVVGFARPDRCVVYAGATALGV